MFRVWSEKDLLVRAGLQCTIWNLNKHTSEFRHKMNKKFCPLHTCLYWNAFEDNFWLRRIRGQAGTIDLTTFGIEAHIV